MICKGFFGPAASPHSIKTPTRKVWHKKLCKNHLSPHESRFRVLMKRSAMSHKALQLSLPKAKDLNMFRLRHSMLQTSYSRHLLQRSYCENNFSVVFAGPLFAAQENAAFEVWKNFCLCKFLLQTMHTKRSDFILLHCVKWSDQRHFLESVVW